MTHRPISLAVPRGSVAAATITEGIDALLAAADPDLPLEFPTEVIAAAEAAASRAQDSAGREDCRDLPFVTLDPASSTDLDQAMHLERTDDGYRVRYAIADVPLFVDLGGVIDAEARRRGATVYLPDRRIPLHPEVLSEAAASLLPEQDTPAFLWDMRLDARGELLSTDLRRALIRSREKLDYEAVQEDLDTGTGHPMMLLLQEIGDLRRTLEAQRGGASLNVPEQEVEEVEGRIRLTWRRPRAIEDANAQISLMTGMAAASLMIEGGSGILRTMPPAEDSAVRRFRLQCEALGVDWPAEMPYGELLRTLDWRNPTHLALLNQAYSLFRGASYAAFSRAEELPEDTVQAAIAAPYAHTTAPLRRLVDRFVLLVCLDHAQGRDPAAELLAALSVIPEAMQRSGARSGNLERSALELVETAALRGVAGQELPGSVIDRREPQDGNSPVRVEIQLQDPPVTAWIEADAALGASLTVLVEDAGDEVRLRVVDGA